MYFCQTRPRCAWANAYVLALKSFSSNISSSEATKRSQPASILWHALCNREFSPSKLCSATSTTRLSDCDQSRRAAANVSAQLVLYSSQPLFSTSCMTVHARELIRFHSEDESSPIYVVQSSESRSRSARVLVRDFEGDDASRSFYVNSKLLLQRCFNFTAD